MSYNNIEYNIDFINKIGEEPDINFKKLFEKDQEKEKEERKRKKNGDRL